VLKADGEEGYGKGTCYKKLILLVGKFGERKVTVNEKAEGI
jgi:hypothetical protein